MSEGTHQADGPPEATADTSATAAPAVAADAELVAALRRGDEAAFMWLVERYHPTLLRLALTYVSDPAVAEEVVQDTWLGVLRGLDGFEGRSSLKTWIVRILINTAKTRAQREARSVPFSSLPDSEAESGEPSVAPERFRPPDAEWPGSWVSIPRNWDEIPEDRLLSREALAQIEQAVEALPANQRAVIRLRDIAGWTSNEACNILGISETNQRVLLHRARSRVRRALERYFDEEQADV